MLGTTQSSYSHSQLTSLGKHKVQAILTRRFEALPHMRIDFLPGEERSVLLEGTACLLKRRGMKLVVLRAPVRPRTSDYGLLMRSRMGRTLPSDHLRSAIRTGFEIKRCS